MNKRVVIAGFGDTGLLVAVNLGPQYEIVGVSPKPCLLSGQELGSRLVRPEEWKRDYLMEFGRFKKLDGVRTIQGSISGIDTTEQTVSIDLPDGSGGSPEGNGEGQGGSRQVEPYDVLVISSGVSNGFWRNDALEDLAEINEQIRRAASQVAGADEIAIIGGGASGVSVAANLAERHPGKVVHLFYGRDQPLPGYHPKARKRLEAQLKRVGVRLHANHRAIIPDGFRCDRMTTDAVEWSTGQPPFEADLTLWAVGRTRPNNAFIPAQMLNEEGFVEVDETLRVLGHANVFAVGDIAASDANRSSARNWGYRIVAHNIRSYLRGDEASMKRYAPPAHRWGSILGVQKNGLRVFQPGGGSFRFPRWSVNLLLFPIAVRRGIYKGIRRSIRR